MLKLRFNLQHFNEGDDVAVDTQPQSEPVVVYGKQEGQPDVDVQTDNEPAGTQPETVFDFAKAQELTPEQKKDYYIRFKETFKDDFSQDFQSHFDRRFKTHKELETKVSQYTPVVSALMKYHNVNSVEELQAIVDNDVMAELAEQAGFPDAKTYKEYLDAVEVGKKGKEILSQASLEEENERYFNDLVAQGVELAKEIPSFSLQEELKNTEFTDALQKGLSVKKAYQLAHMDEIIAERAKAASENTVQSIKTKQQRIPENGAKVSPSVIIKNDPSKLSEADIEDIQRRIARGERISF